MKLLLVCAGGMSTGILMNKMKKWFSEKGEELVINAVGLGGYEEEYSNGYECILIGPQVSYMLETIRKNTNGVPVAKIEPYDYALGNVENIMKQVHKLLGK